MNLKRKGTKTAEFALGEEKAIFNSISCGGKIFNSIVTTVSGVSKGRFSIVLVPFGKQRTYCSACAAKADESCSDEEILLLIRFPCCSWDCWIILLLLLLLYSTDGWISCMSAAVSCCAVLDEVLLLSWAPFSVFFFFLKLIVELVQGGPQLFG